MRPWPPLLSDFCLCLEFFTRFPCPSSGQKPGFLSLADFSRAIRVLPLAGGAIGILAALALSIALRLALPPVLAAPLAIGTLIAVSGAMHEDGLADCADGFFGGATREQKLAIMRDSRLGTFGAVALLLSLYMRVASLTVITGQNQWLADTVLIGAAALSRTVSLVPLALLPSARENGAGFAAGKPDTMALATAASVSFLFALAPVLSGAALMRALAATTLATGAAFAVAALAKHQIGGQTGDVAGAAQQLGETAFYLAFAAA